MDIKASDVKKLREATGAGMMDCKKALVEAGGDFAKAEKILKELGLAAAAKRSDRATNEGRVFAKVIGDKAGVLELSCETDFVARNTDFITMGEEILDDILSNNLSEVTPELEKKVADAVAKIKENMSIRRFKTLDINENQAAVSYIHGEGRIGVLVKLEADKPEAAKSQKIQDFLFDCALHIAAFNPLYLQSSDVDSAYVAEQEAIFKKQAENLGKPEKVLEGIVKGKLNKHLSEICFLEQGFVKDEKQKVAAVLKSIGKEVGAELKITDYVYYKVGDEA